MHYNLFLIIFFKIKTLPKIFPLCLRCNKKAVEYISHYMVESLIYWSIGNQGNATKMYVMR